MSDQLRLFDPPVPYVRGSDTSKAAAGTMVLVVGSLRFEVLRFIRSEGELGATCDAIECALDMRHQTASARVNELRNGGFIFDSGERRNTRSGRKATVWLATVKP